MNVEQDQRTIARVHCHLYERQESKVAQKMLWDYLSQWSPRACQGTIPEGLTTWRDSIFRRDVDSLLQLLVYQTLLKARLLTLHVQQHLLSLSNLCFFCLEDRKESFHEVCTFNVGKQLQKVVDESKNQTWKVQLSAVITEDDARAIDVEYHFSYWVQNVQRGATSSSENRDYAQQEANVGTVVSDIEFVSLICTLLQAGEVLNMADLNGLL
ncbi:hypothetical protein SK128_020338 [Halocaridina rubra]|uniref:Uncharacterized protein n=1 Tax=Halocaridina rubra TaxID=373956 RepID=A0AAN8WEK9_HALRR